MMVVSRGHVVFEYGDLTVVSKVASIRKSVLISCSLSIQGDNLRWNTAGLMPVTARI